MSLAIAMAILMREAGFKPHTREKRQLRKAFSQTFFQGIGEVRRQPVLLTILLIAAVYGMFSAGVHRLNVPYFIEHFSFPQIGATDTIVWWGIIGAVNMAAGFGSVSLATRYVDTDNHAQLSWTLGCATAVSGLCIIAFANLSSFYPALFCFWVANALGAATAPLSMAWVNRLIPDRSRATVLSLHSQASAVGEAVGGPLLGGLAKFYSIPIALTAAAMSLLPALALFWRGKNQAR